jgi:hypothetical protein
MKKANQTKEQSGTTLFNSVCTCGMVYENCTVDCNRCPEFKMHKQAVLTKHNIKLKGWK